MTHLHMPELLRSADTAQKEVQLHPHTLRDAAQVHRVAF